VESGPRREQQFDPGITQRYDGAIRRIINRDGTFNVRRRGRRLKDFHVYKFLLALSWPSFLGLVLGIFVAMNVVFAALYGAAGIQNLAGAAAPTPAEMMLNAFFFSVQTLTTVGYGVISPHGVVTNLIASMEAMMGVMGFAFTAGLLYGRFSRPSARILFSEHALVAPFQGGTSLQFRVANRRSNAIVNLEAKVLLMTVDRVGGVQKRSYAQLALERPAVFFLPLTWTIVHPIDQASPLYGVTAQQLADRSAEFLVLINGFDDTFSQVVHARTSYRYDEIIWGARFTSAFHADDRGELVLRLDRIDETEPTG